MPICSASNYNAKAQTLNCYLLFFYFAALLCIELLFRYDFRELWRNNLLDRFKKEVAKEIGKRTRCATGRLTGVDVFDVEERMTAYRFYVMPSESVEDGKLQMCTTFVTIQ